MREVLVDDEVYVDLGISHSKEGYLALDLRTPEYMAQAVQGEVVETNLVV